MSGGGGGGAADAHRTRNGTLYTGDWPRFSRTPANIIITTMRNRGEIMCSMSVNVGEKIELVEEMLR